MTTPPADAAPPHSAGANRHPEYNAPRSSAKTAATPRRGTVHPRADKESIMNMFCSAATTAIVEKALSGIAMSFDECVQLLSLPETSSDAAVVRAAADKLSRSTFSGGMIQGQIGIDFLPCVADCKFCSFAKSHTAFELIQMDEAGLVGHIEGFTSCASPLTALFLMAHHEFDYDFLLQSVATAKQHIPASTKLVLNIGDFTRQQAEELRAAGVTGIYHVLRLREGIDTQLTKDDRIATIENLKDAGLDWYYCCEPIGPEHSNEELAEQILLGAQFSCYQHAAMRRINFEHSPLIANGSITELRMGNILSVARLAMAENTELTSMAVHEPCVTGLLSGANTVYAESGGNPRDTSEETSEGRGRNLDDCAEMLRDASWSI